MHKMNNDVMPSLQTLDALVKEQKVKISLFSFGERRSKSLSFPFDHRGRTVKIICRLFEI